MENKPKRQPTAWNRHLDAFRKEHPEMSLKDQMKAASKTYTKKK